MISLLHVAGLTSWRRGRSRQGFVLLQRVSNAVLRGRIHFPLRMVKTHVARLARLRLPCFLDRESVACMAYITGSGAESRAGLSQILYLGFGFYTNLVASAATLFTVNERFRLLRGGWHCRHAQPSDSVFPA